MILFQTTNSPAEFKHKTSFENWSQLHLIRLTKLFNRFQSAKSAIKIIQSATVHEKHLAVTMFPKLIYGR